MRPFLRFVMVLVRANAQTLLKRPRSLSPPVMCPLIKRLDDPACGFLKQTGDQCMHQRRPRRCKEQCREFQRKQHMLKESLIHFRGVVQKNACKHVRLLG